MRSRVLYLLTAVLILPVALWLTACTDYDGDVMENMPPEVEFVNVHQDIDNMPDDVEVDTVVYDYAPVIYWKGSDEDGFIEYYSYADITEAAAIENPLDYIPRIPQEAWVDTIATQATITLLSDPDEITEHVFYVRAFDNEGAESPVKYRRFYRTNNAPVVPRIGLTGDDEENFNTRYVVEDTLFSAPSITNIYSGIEFSWRGSDPDDKALFTIPLEYQAILIKAPAETVFVNPWSDEVEIQLVDLETGYYALNVWARDDGLTKSVAPARAEFYAIRPTFENNLLLVLESAFPSYSVLTNPPDRDTLRVFYEDLLTEIAPQISNTQLDLSSDTDVRIYSVYAPSQAVPRSLMAQYKLVIFAADHYSETTWNAYTETKQAICEDYLRVGGRIWQMGRCLTNTGAFYGDFNNIEMYSEFFGVDSLAAPPDPYQVPIPPVPAMRAEFIGTLPGLPSFTALEFDSTKVKWNGYNLPGTMDPHYYENSYGLTGVDRIQRNDDATTTQQFVSGTFGSEVSIENEDSHVLPTGLSTFDNDYPNYLIPATPTNAFIVLKNDNVSEITRIVNWTLFNQGKENYEAQPVVTANNLAYISYTEGEPWSNSDSLQVDYTYSPISVMHLKPVEIRVEGYQGGNQINPNSQLRFRTALTTFSYFFVDHQGTVENWIQMLDWLYNPNLNNAEFDF